MHPPAPARTREPLNRSKGVRATPTRESARIRNAQAQAEAEEVVANTVSIDTVSTRTVICAAVNDAVIGLVKSPPFVKTLAGLIKEKLFEGAVAEANKKLPLTEAQLKRVVEDNSATVHGILKSSLRPQLEKATEVG